MNEIAFLDYTFMFDPSEVYQHRFQFDQDLAKFFELNGLIAEKVPPVEGSGNRCIVFLKKKPMIVENNPEKEKSIKEVKAGLMKGRGFDGKYQGVRPTSKTR